MRNYSWVSVISTVPSRIENIIRECIWLDEFETIQVEVKVNLLKNNHE